MKHLVVFKTDKNLGSTAITFNHYPPTLEDIRMAENEIRKSNGLMQDVVITNWLEIAE